MSRGKGTQGYLVLTLRKLYICCGNNIPLLGIQFMSPVMQGLSDTLPCLPLPNTPHQPSSSSPTFQLSFTSQLRDHCLQAFPNSPPLQPPYWDRFLCPGLSQHCTLSTSHCTSSISFHTYLSTCLYPSGDGGLHHGNSEVWFVHRSRCLAKSQTHSNCSIDGY